MAVVVATAVLRHLSVWGLTWEGFMGSAVGYFLHMRGGDVSCRKLVSLVDYEVETASQLERGAVDGPGPVTDCPCPWDLS